MLWLQAHFGPVVSALLRLVMIFARRAKCTSVSDTVDKDSHLDASCKAQTMLPSGASFVPSKVIHFKS